VARPFASIGAPGDTASDGAVRRAAGVASYSFGKPYTPNTRSGASYDVAKFISDTYERLTWCYRCINAIASRAAQLRAVVRKGDFANGAELDDHELLSFLNYQANPFENAFEFRSRLSAQISSSPRGAFVEKQLNKGGDAFGYYLLPPQFTRPIPDPTTFVSGYELRIGSYVETIPAERVLWFKNPHPLDPYRSMTPAEAAGLAIDTAWLARMFNANWLRADGRPGGLINAKGLNGPDADELRSYFGSAQRAGEWRVIDVEDLDVEDMGSNPRDGQYLEHMQSTKEEVLMAYGVPESILGNAAGRTFDNADAEQEIFWSETMPPHLRLIGGGFDRVDQDPTTFVSFDLSTVGVIQRLEARRADRLLGELNAGAISRDEYREDTGREAVNVPATKTLYRPMSLVAIATTDGTQFEDSSKPKTPPPPPAGFAPNPGPAPAPQDAAPAPAQDAPPAPEGKGRKDVRASGDLPQVHDAQTGRDNLRQLALLHLAYWESALQSEMVRFFQRQEHVVVARLTGPKARKGTRHWNGPGRSTKGIDVADVFQTDRWNEDLARTASDFFGTLMNTIGGDVFRTLGLGLSFDLHGPKVQAALSKRVNQIVGINDTTETVIRDELKAGEAAGEGITKLADRVRGVFRDATNSRAETIARTEVVGATNEAQLSAAAQSGVVSTKEWLATEDSRTRPEHADLDGSIVDLDGTFSNDFGEIAYPGDPSADAANVINCRCTLLYQLQPGQTAPDDVGDGGD
jgi:HK97 family phage portal protein